MTKHPNGFSWIKDAFFRLSPAVLVLFVLMALVPIISDNLYFVEVLNGCLIFALCVMSWDVLGGYCAQPNFGHAFFIGGAAYAAALLNIHSDLSPALLVPIGGLIAMLCGLGIGYLTLRLEGGYFALATMIFNAMLFKLAFMFHWIFGGEEGLSGIDTITDTPTGDFYVCLVVTFLSYVLLTLFTRSKYGLILESTKFFVEDAAEASGINTAYYKILAYVISAFFAGIGGGLFTHVSMHVGPYMVSGALSVEVMIFAMIGGAGTIVGPLLMGLFVSLFHEWLRFIDEYRTVIMLGLLFLVFYFNPKGLFNSDFLRRSKVLNRIFFGRNS